MHIVLRFAFHARTANRGTNTLVSTPLGRSEESLVYRPSVRTRHLPTTTVGDAPVNGRLISVTYLRLKAKFVFNRSYEVYCLIFRYVCLRDVVKRALVPQKHVVV